MSKIPISIRGSLGWIGLERLGEVALQLAAIGTLARILPPSDYGLMAMAATIVQFASLFRDMGTAFAIVQRHDLDEELTSSVFWLNTFLGISLALLLAAIFPLLADFYSESRLRTIIVLIAPVFVLSALGTVQRALLERAGQFRHLATIGLVSGIASLIVAVVIAVAGGGVYALVGQSLFSAATSTAAVALFSGWRPRPRVSIRSLRGIWRFSSDNFLGSLVNYFHRNADSMLIGRALGPELLGFYNVGYRILLFPLQHITYAVSRASYPAYCRHQGDRGAIGQHYLNSLRTIAFLTAPMMAAVWAFREPLLIVVMGKKWLPAAGVIAFLAPVGFVQSMVSSTGTVLNAIGRSDLLRNLQFFGTPVYVASIAIGLKWGIEGVAAAYCAANVLMAFPVMRIVLAQLSVSLSAFVVGVSKPAIFAIIVAVALRLVTTSCDWALAQPSLVVVLVGGCVFAISYLALARTCVPKELAKYLPFVRIPDRGDS